MSFSLTWLPQVLLEAGLKVSEVPGWKTRGLAPFGEPFGVICHHTVGRRDGNMPSLNTLIEGRKPTKKDPKGLRGPLANLGLGRDGTYYVIAAGKANHAGPGVWQGVTTGNTNFIGIEAENTGLPNDFPWPEVQVEAYHRGVAAILGHIGRTADFCCGHKEYATPKGRKPDPNLDMDVFRAAVAALLGQPAPPRLIPKTDASNRPTLRRGDTGEHVQTLQARLKVVGPPAFGPKTEAAVRAFQRERGLVPDGIVGPKTWEALDGLA